MLPPTRSAWHRNAAMDGLADGSDFVWPEGKMVLGEHGFPHLGRWGRTLEESVSSMQGAGPGGPAVAVGTAVAHCPPHRPVLALLTHTVPASDTDVWRQSARWPLRAHAPAHVTHRSGTVSGTG